MATFLKFTQHTITRATFVATTAVALQHFSTSPTFTPTFTSTPTMSLLLSSFSPSSFLTTTPTTTLVDTTILNMNRNHRKPKRGNKSKRAVSNYSRKQKALSTRKPKYSPAPYRPLESKPEV